MRKALFVFIAIWIGFLTEFLWLNSFARWSCPNILVVEVVFFNLLLGIRYGLAAAFMAGVLKDSFSVGVMGEHMLCFVIMAFGTTLLRKHIYSSGSKFSKIVLVIAALLIHYFVLIIIRFATSDIDISMLFIYVALPQLIVSLFTTVPIMNFLKQCVSKLSFMLL